MKKILWAIGIILAVYIVFVASDSIRLSHKTTAARPFITVSTAEAENRSRYTGLGYSVTYYKDSVKDTDRSIYGAQFMLFDKILIWGWVE